MFRNALIAATALACTVSAARAQSAQEFYKGKQLRLIFGHEESNE